MPKQIVDQLQRVINLKQRPNRIISLVPSQTELLCYLGLKDSIVGITKYCVHPSDLKKSVSVVGGTKQIHLDRIVSLNPDIILCNKEENTKEIVQVLEGICTVHISAIFTIEDSLELISQYGKIFNKAAEALLLIRNIQKEANEFDNFIKNEPILKVAYFIWKNPWMVAGNNTFIDYLLQINKFENEYANKDRYPEIQLSKKSVSKDVDLVLLSSEPYPFKEIHKEELRAYYPKAKIILVDGEMFSWYGSRLVKAFEYFKKLHLDLQDIQIY